MGNVLPPQVHDMLSTYLAVDAERSWLVLTLAALAAVIFAADLMGSLMEGFRAAYQAPRRPSLWTDYWISVALVFVSIFPLAAANAGIILSRQIEVWAMQRFGPARWLAQTSRLASGRLRWRRSLILAALYYMAPNRRQRWRDVWPGNGLAAARWRRPQPCSPSTCSESPATAKLYGNLSTLVVLMIWTYMVSVIVMLGCEFNAARERRLGTLPPRPREAQ